MMDDFHFAMLSMNGNHGLAEHNRKYFYDIVDKTFEPIYYDGDLRLEKLDNEYEKYLKNYSFYKEYLFPYKNELVNDEFIQDLESEFKNKINFYGKKEKDIFLSKY